MDAAWIFFSPLGWLGGDTESCKNRGCHGAAPEGQVPICSMRSTQGKASCQINSDRLQGPRGSKKGYFFLTICRCLTVLSIFGGCYTDIRKIMKILQKVTPRQIYIWKALPLNQLSGTKPGEVDCIVGPFLSMFRLSMMIYLLYKHGEFPQLRSIVRGYHEYQ